MLYRISVKPRGGSWTTYQRDGRIFPAVGETVLTDAELTPAMREDPLLLITPLDTPEPEQAQGQPSRPTRPIKTMDRKARGGKRNG